MLKLLKRARQPSGHRAAVRPRAFSFHRHACLPVSLMAPAFALAVPTAVPAALPAAVLQSAPQSPSPDSSDADAIQREIASDDAAIDGQGDERHRHHHYGMLLSQVFSGWFLK